jgi:HK97 family phage major capsid protein
MEQVRSVWRLSGVRRLLAVLMVSVAVMFDGYCNLPWRHGGPGRGRSLAAGGRVRSLVAAGVAPSGGAVGLAYQSMVQSERELRAKADGLFEKARSKKGKLKQEPDNDDLTAEVNALMEEYDKAFGELESVRAEIGLEDRHREAMRQETRRKYEADGGGEREDVGGGGFPKRTPQLFKGFGEQLQAVAAHKRAGVIDPRLAQINLAAAGLSLSEINAAVSGASEGVLSDGGFLVQTDFADDLLSMTHETGKLWSKVDRTPVGADSDGLKINVVDETSRANGSRWGGVVSYWEAEGAPGTGSKPKFRQMELNLHKLFGLYYATNELLKDSTALGQVASTAFAEEFGFKLDDGVIRGPGAGQFLGILGHSGTVSVGKETGQAAASILGENVKKMYARMSPQSIARATWYINQDCWQQIFELSHVIGTGGVPLYVPAGGLSSAPFGTLLGRPVEPIEQCESVGTVGDIIFADLSQYKGIEKGGIDAASSIHVLFLTDEMTFRFILRADGQPKRKEALTPYKGTATTSAFITLATRA